MNDAMKALEEMASRLDAIDGLQDWSEEVATIRAALEAKAEPVGDLAATTLDEVEAWSLAPQEPTADETERLGFRNMSECDVDGGVELWWKNGELIRVTVVARDAFNRSKIVSMRIPDAARTSTAEVEARALEDAANIFQMCHQPKVASELREMAKRRRSECHE
jgi:hypothetical protein